MKTSEKIESGLMKSRGIGLKILDGKAFVEYIQNFDPTEKFIIDLNFLHYRYRTQAVQVSHEPKFNEVKIIVILVHNTNIFNIYIKILSGKKYRSLYNINTIK